MIPIDPTLCVAYGHPSGKPFHYIAVARKVSYMEMLRLEPGQKVGELKDELRHFTEVHGLDIAGQWEFMTTDAPMLDPLSLDKWVAVKVPVVYKDPSPGYDADGREVWEYP